ncbi:MAG TPA: acyltransferase family protein [Steroidobacter sp.]|uniref:acyltransferase family protein n=1 Tax=Steroidobacter sp. TaxID=1978227 RepID=UPI002ED9DAA0
MHTHIDASASVSLAGSGTAAPEAIHQAKSSPIRVKQRIVAVDAARGCAMLLVCLSHIKPHFEVSAPEIYTALVITTRVATPTFLMLSGFVIGHLLRGNAREDVRWLLVDRGLFLVLVVHFLLGLNELSYLPFSDWVFGKVMITDVIGVALCVAVVIRGASTAALFAAGGALFVMSWIVAMTLVPESEGMQLLGAVLFHLHSAPNRLIDIAFLPYLGVFLMGMGLSSYCREALQNGETGWLARRLGTMGLIAIGLVITGILAWHFFKHALPEGLREPHVMSLLRATLHPGYKAPPSPAYLLFYAGAGLVMTGLFFHGRPRWLASMTGKAAVIGKASLLCFIAQDWLLFLIPQLLGFHQLTSVPFWFGYLALVVLILFYLSRQWIRLDGNRFFTVGLKRFMRRRRATAQVLTQA